MAKTQQTGTHYTAVETGTLDSWADKVLDLGNGRTVQGKFFLRDLLGSNACEISINSTPVGGSAPFWHAHKQNEELYIFLRGEGEMKVDGDTVAVREGSIVRLAPAAERVYRNTGNVPLVYLVMQIQQDSLKAATAGDGVILKKDMPW